MLSPGPLTEEEIKELDQFLLEAEGIEESMDISTLDGFFTAIVCGPKTIMPSEWLRSGCGTWRAAKTPRSSRIRPRRSVFLTS